MFDTKLPVSYYKRIGVLNEEHGVYIVQHRENGKVFIEKVLRVYDPGVYEQLFRHPVRGIPRIYAMYEESGTLTVIEEYISGETLEEILSICGRLPEEDVIDCTVKLCDILSSLHSQDPMIIHRDIKPSNVILTEDGRVVLLALNAARKAAGPKERDTRLLGTKGYAAPEQYGFGSSAPQTDIYAAGVLMRSLLLDETPSGKLRDVIAKCLEMNPKDRYSSALQLKNALLKCRKRS